jgi:hypothetical protein
LGRNRTTQPKLRTSLTHECRFWQRQIRSLASSLSHKQNCALARLRHRRGIAKGIRVQDTSERLKSTQNTQFAFEPMSQPPSRTRVRLMARCRSKSSCNVASSSVGSRGRSWSKGSLSKLDLRTSRRSISQSQATLQRAREWDMFSSFGAAHAQWLTLLRVCLLTYPSRSHTSILPMRTQTAAATAPKPRGLIRRVLSALMFSKHKSKLREMSAAEITSTDTTVQGSQGMFQALNGGMAMMHASTW